MAPTSTVMSTLLTIAVICVSLAQDDTRSKKPVDLLLERPSSCPRRPLAGHQWRRQSSGLSRQPLPQSVTADCARAGSQEQSAGGPTRQHEGDFDAVGAPEVRHLEAHTGHNVLALGVQQDVRILCRRTHLDELGAQGVRVASLAERLVDASQTMEAFWEAALCHCPCDAAEGPPAASATGKGGTNRVGAHGMLPAYTNTG